MDITLLKYVMTLAEEKNFSRAAERLFITQPTLSLQLKKLESELGFPLFTRNTKNVELTSYGKQFVKQAKPVVSKYENFTKWVEQTRTLRNTRLSFGSSAISMPHVSACIPDFLTQFPDIEFNYVEAWDPDLADMIRSGELDIALISVPKDEESRAGLYILPIHEEYVCAAVSSKNPLFGKEAVSLEDLKNEKLITTSKNSGLYNLMKQEFAKKGIEADFSMHVVSIEGRLSMLDRHSVTFVMNEQFKLYKPENIAIIPVVPKVYRTFGLATAAKRETTVLENSFLHILKDNITARLEQ